MRGNSRVKISEQARSFRKRRTRSVLVSRILVRDFSRDKAGKSPFVSRGNYSAQEGGNEVNDNRGTSSSDKAARISLWLTDTSCSLQLRPGSLCFPPTEHRLRFSLLHFSPLGYRLNVSKIENSCDKIVLWVWCPDFNLENRSNLLSRFFPYLSSTELNLLGSVPAFLISNFRREI